jgi:phasin family protein
MKMTEQTTATSDPKGTPSQDVKNAAPDITGLLERFKLPGFDLDGFVESRKQDIDAVKQATSAAFAGAQTIVDKQTELLKTVLTEASDALRTLPEDAAKPAELVRKQGKLANQALSSALASMKEIAETLREKQSEILEIASSRVRSNVEEIRRLAKRPETHENDAK